MLDCILISIFCSYLSHSRNRIDPSNVFPFPSETSKKQKPTSRQKVIAKQITCLFPTQSNDHNNTIIFNPPYSHRNNPSNWEQIARKELSKFLSFILHSSLVYGIKTFSHCLSYLFLPFSLAMSSNFLQLSITKHGEQQSVWNFPFALIISCLSRQTPNKPAKQLGRCQYFMTIIGDL